jgi:hypothetical protein
MFVYRAKVWITFKWEEGMPPQFPVQRELHMLVSGGVPNATAVLEKQLQANDLLDEDDGKKIEAYQIIEVVEVCPIEIIQMDALVEGLKQLGHEVNVTFPEPA